MLALEKRLRMLLLAFAACLACGAAWSQSTFLPYGSTQYEHSNNIFYLPNSTALYLVSGDSVLGDSDLKTVGGADVNYLWGRQRFYGTIEGRNIEYDHYGDLSHEEYLVKAGLDWKLFSEFDGTFLSTTQRYMAPFANRDTFTQLALDLDRDVIAKFNMQVAPEWRLETSEDYHNLDSPIQFYPAYGLTETTSHLALKYLGVAKLTYGLAIDYLDGKYRNAPIDGTYTQTAVNLTMTYAVTRLSSFHGAVGHTERDQGENQGNLSAVTGNLGYTRALSGKTTVSMDYTRAVNSYIAAGGSELDTTVALKVNFQATFKTGISASYQEMWSDFLGETIPGTDVLGRRDRTPGAFLNVNYQALRWLSIQPYVYYQRRTSTVEFYDFTNTTVGLRILAKMQPPPQR
jgi:hypothetical protein